MTDTIKIEIEAKTTEKPEWYRVYVNEELMISTDKKESILKFMTTLLSMGVAII